MPASTVAARPAEQRANRFIFILLGLQRLSYAIPALAVAGSPAYRSPILNAALLAAWLTWNGWLFGRAYRLSWFPDWAPWLDVALACVLMIVVADNLPSELVDAAPNWTGRVAQAAAALAGAAIVRLGSAAFAVTALLAVHAVVTAVHYPAQQGLALELVSCLNGLLWFAVVIGFGVRYLRRQGQLLDDAGARRTVAESRLAADQARYETRLAHHRALHDTVLTTLTTLSRGGLDHRSAQVRQRCARDAEYVRRLLADDGAATPHGATEQLTDVVDDAELLGLHVHLRHDGLPADLPADVVLAFAGATREALNNVVKHAGVTVAWVTATWDDGTLRIAIVDRGRGFDAAATGAGSGMRRSIVERVQAVHGQARISTTPGDGTCVELKWQR